MRRSEQDTLRQRLQIELGFRGVGSGSAPS